MLQNSFRIGRLGGERKITSRPQVQPAGIICFFGKRQTSAGQCHRIHSRGSFRRTRIRAPCDLRPSANKPFIHAMDDLAAFQKRIEENQAKLDAIEAKRKALDENAKKRKLEEEKDRIKKAEEENVKRMRKMSSLSKPRAKVEAKHRISVAKGVQLLYSDDELSGSLQPPFRVVNNRSLLLVTGNHEGKVEVWDALNSFACNVQVDIKAETMVSAMAYLGTINMNVPKRKEKKTQTPEEEEAQAIAAKIAEQAAKAQKDKGEPESAPSEPPALPLEVRNQLYCSVVAATAGCDIALINTKSWSIVYVVEDAHDNEIQALCVVSRAPAEAPLIVSCALDSSLFCWCGSRWDKLFAMKGHSDAVVSMAVMPAALGQGPETSRVCTGSDDTSIKVWDILGMSQKARSQKARQSKTLPTGKKESDEPLLFEDECEHSLDAHDDFVGCLCPVSIGICDNSTRHDFMVSASADFSVIVWNRAWEKVRVLEADRFVVQISTYGNTLLASFRSGAELDECSLMTWHMDGPNPATWKQRGAFLNIPIPSALVAERIVPSDYSPASNKKQAPPAAKGKDFALVLTTSDDEPNFYVWSCPFKVPSLVALPKPQSAIPESSIPAKEGVTVNNNTERRQQQQQQQKQQEEQTTMQTSQIVQSSTYPRADLSQQVVVAGNPPAQGTFSGDLMAKKFITNILDLDNLSPDMRRLLSVASNLHT